MGLGVATPVAGVGRLAADLALARHRARSAPALLRRPPRTDCQQPDLHHADLGRPVAHRHAGGVLGLPDVRRLPGGAGEVLPEGAHSRRYCPSGARGTHAVREQVEAAGRGGPDLPVDYRGHLDAHHRPHAQRHLAGARTPARGAARAGLLGDRDARTVAARRQPDGDFAVAVGLARLGRGRAERGRYVSRGARVRAARTRHGCLVSLRAQHPCGMAPRAGRWVVRRRRLRVRQASTRLVHRQCAELLDGLRCVCNRADLSCVDLCRLGDRAARGGDRRLRAEPASGSDRAWPPARAPLRVGGRGAACTGRCANG